MNAKERRETMISSSSDNTLDEATPPIATHLISATFLSR
jgi:hypothetical protein